MNFTPARIFCAAGLTGFALVAAQFSMAQAQSAPMGAIEASIGGKGYVGETRKVPSGTSTATFQAYGPMVNLTLQAHDPQADRTMQNIVTMQISLMGNDASASVTASSVSYWPDGMNEPFYTSEEGGGETQVTFDTLTFNGGDARASGTFTTTVCAKESYFREIDKTDCLPVEGRFDTALHKAG